MAADPTDPLAAALARARAWLEANDERRRGRMLVEVAREDPDFATFIWLHPELTRGGDDG